MSADQYCSAMQDTVIDAMEGVVDTVTRDDPNILRRVATYGNSNPLVPGDWVQILRNAPTPTTVSADKISHRKSIWTEVVQFLSLTLNICLPLLFW